jgi:uncharacterized membrane protein YoaK (UPF0700 family)
LWPVLAFVAGILVARALRHRDASDTWPDSRAMDLVFETVVLVIVALLPTDARQWAIATSIVFASALQLASFAPVGVDSRDWALAGTNATIDNAVANAHNGAIVEEHVGGGGANNRSTRGRVRSPNSARVATASSR